MINKIYKRMENENDDQLVFRIYSDKEAGINDYTNAEAGQVLNQLTGTNWDESAYRKKYQYFKKVFENCDIVAQLQGNDYAQKLDEKYEELIKLKTKVADRAREYHGMIRREARTEAFIEAIKESANEAPTLDRTFIREFEGRGEAILCISDWHIGGLCNNFYNSFNLDIAKQRIQTLRNKTIEYCKIFKVKVLKVVNLGDMIEGIIHINGRIEQQFNVVSQVKTASQLIYNLLADLAEHVEVVTYSQCLDNHSRVNADYKEHIEEESFGKLIEWYVSEKITSSKNLNIFIENNKIDDNIGLISAGNKHYFFVHGHLDKPNTVLQDLVFGTGIMVDGVLLGHYHNDKVKNFHGKKVYFNSSLIGTNSYALNHRLFAKPSQTLLIFKDEDVCHIPLELE